MFGRMPVWKLTGSNLIMKKSAITVLSLFLVMLLGATNPQKPNILFIMSDDHTSQAIGAYGGRLQKLNPTPTIDKLAENGMVMFVITSYSIHYTKLYEPEGSNGQCAGTSWWC